MARILCRQLILAALAVLLATVMTLALRSSYVDVGLDFSSDPTSPVVLGRSDAQGQFTPLAEAERIEEEFSPFHYAFEIEVPEDGGGEVELFFEGSPDLIEVEPKNAWSRNGTYMALTGAQRPARVRFEGWHWGPDVCVDFTRDMRSGRVILRGQGYENEVSLASETTVRVNSPDRLSVTVSTDQRLWRYYARIPRRDLCGLAVSLEAAQSKIHRLYVGTLIPRLFFAGQAPPRLPPGRTHEHWSPKAEANQTMLPPVPAWERGGLVTLLVLCALCYAAFATALFCGRWVWRALQDNTRETRLEDSQTSSALKPFNIWEFLGYWSVPAIAWAFFLLCFWPGTLNIDALEQWRQAHEFEFDTAQPPLYALAFWILTRAWDSPAAIALSQIVVLSCVFAWGFSLLRRAGVPRIVIGFCLAWIALSPKNATSVIALIKDTPYAISMVALVVVLFHLLLDPAERKRWRLWPVVALTLGLLPLFRHNGLMVSLGTAALLPIFFARAWRKALAAGALGFLVWSGITCALFSYLPIKDTPIGRERLMMGHLAILLDRDVPVSRHEYAFLASFRSLHDRWAYAKFRVDGTVLSLGFPVDAENLRESAPTFAALYVNLISRNPILGLGYFLERSEYLYLPWASSFMETFCLGIDRNTNGLASTEFILDWPDRLRAILVRTVQPDLIWLFWRPALPFYVCIGFTLVLVNRRGVRYSLPAFGLFINTLSLFITAIAQNARYQLPLTLASILFLAAAFLPRASSECRARSGRTSRNPGGQAKV